MGLVNVRQFPNSLDSDRFPRVWSVWGFTHTRNGELVTHFMVRAQTGGETSADKGDSAAQTGRQSSADRAVQTVRDQRRQGGQSSADR
jgi:hypothetical protein